MTTAAYDDDFGTCADTYVTLCIYDWIPDFVTTAINIEPSTVQYRNKPSDHAPNLPPFKPNAWFLTSEGVIFSRDARRHLDWLLDRIEPANHLLRDLRDQGAQMHIWCYWQSASGHGGPVLSSQQAKRLGELDLELEFDVYFY